MKVVSLVAALASVGTPAFHIDLGHYFPSVQVEKAQRLAELAEVRTFTNVSASSLNSPQALLGWLNRYDQLCEDLQRHDTYVYLRAEEDTADHADAAADAMLNEAVQRIDDSVRKNLTGIGDATLSKFMTQDHALSRYRYFIYSMRNQAKHLSENQNAVRLLAEPALDSLVSSYKALRPPPVSPPSSSSVSESSARQAFQAKWSPYERSEKEFAALLTAIVHLRNGEARLQGFPRAPDARYFFDGLSSAEVDGTLRALRKSDANTRFQLVLAKAAEKHLHIPLGMMHAWDLTFADTYHPPPMSFPNVVPIILAAAQPMGSEYAGHFARLFAPADHRVEWCNEPRCDHSGFSVGYAGITSGLFYGSYDGTTNSIRAVAHEAGHAVHRQFMNENQPIAAYNSGPHFMFESFAVFNEMLLLDHLYKTAPTSAAKAYYLHRLVEEVTFNVFGSAEETDLEQSIYAGVQNGTVRTAADLDRLTLKVFSRYTQRPALSTEMKEYWAWNSLYFTDSLYDVNYLFAQLLAIQYLHRFENDAHSFSKQYIALLKNGFTDTPQVLEKRFLGIDLSNTNRLVEDAATFINQRTSILEELYDAQHAAAR